MGSAAKVYKESFINTSSAIQKLIGGNIQTRRQYDNLISIQFFFQNKESRLKIGKGMLKDFHVSYKKHPVSRKASMPEKMVHMCKC
jgi:hypothetical protein